ncbi:PAS domain S-box protein [Tolypothrix sp. PCC 7910]|uniref:PAS domain S-box protein n=1 Tax=Tolypothrix sp. PCC 7910 TaxID=2099387 RepID=UPI0014277B61|nr:PAS domain S-box protein [Tolypothrix sp. PCC 7910]QIR41086.1 PAS domain S-box protein [Tolypothrix sp. PCC 7910]UDM54161.1 TPL0176 [Tolypothrix sp. PCC 7910]
MSHLPLLTILLIDDCAEDRVTYRRFLQHDSRYIYRILEFDTATAAMNWCQYEIPDVILLDFALPNGDGLEFIRQLREQLRNSQSAVIMVTGQGDETIAVQAMKSGAQDYLLKSQLTPTILHSAIHYAVEQLRLLRQLEQSREQQHLIAAIALRIRQSLKLEEILRITAKEVRQFLKADRVLVYQFQPDMSGTVVAESVLPGWTVSLGMEIQDTCFQEGAGSEYYQGKKRATNDIYQAGFTDCHLQLLEQFEVKANLVVPILVKDSLWGLLIAHQCSRTRNWEAMEIELLDQLGVQLSLAIQQANAYQQLQTELTERKWVEAALQASEEKLKLTLDFAHIGYWERNFITNEILASDNAICYFGYERNSINVTNEEWLSKIHPEDQEWVQGQLKQAIANKTDYVVEYRVVWPDNSIHWISSTGRAVYDHKGLPLVMLGVLMDISDRKQAEEKLRESEERFRSTFEQAAVGISHVSLSGQFIRFNQKFCEILGYTPAELQKLTFQEMTYPDDLAGGLQQSQKLLTGEMQTFSLEKRYIRQDGSIVWANLTCSLLRDRLGAPKYFISVIEDISHRKQMEAELRQNQEHLNMALEAADMGNWDWNITTGKVYWSPNLQRIFGMVPGTFNGNYETVVSMMHPEDRESVLQAINAAVYQKQEYHIEFRFIKADGTPRWALGNGKVFYDEQGNPTRMVGIDLDITERKQAEAILKESEERFRQIADSSPVLMWISGTDKLCHYFNRSWLEFTGRTLEQELGNGWLEKVHPDDYQNCLNTYVKAFDSRQSFQMEYRLQRFDGEYRWILDKGVPRFTDEGEFLGYMGSCIDISDRILAEQALQQLNQELEGRVEQRTAALKESEERWQLALKGSNDGIWDWNLKTNEVFFSTRWKEMRGYAEDEMDSNIEAWWNIIHPDDYERFRKSLDDHFAQKTPFFVEEYRVKHKNGSYIWVLNRGQALWDESGNVIRMSGATKDITERKLAEEELRKSQAHLSAAQRVARLGSWEFNLQTMEGWWSRETYEIYGRNPDEQPPSSLEENLQYIHPEDREYFTKKYHELLAESYQELEYRLLRPDSTITYVLMRVEVIYDTDNQPISIVGAILDITERKQAEAELLALSSLQQAILDGSDYAIISVNSQGLIQTFNSGAQKMLGYTAEEAINNTPELFHDLVEIQERSEILSRELGRPVASPIEFFSIKNQDGTYEDEWTYIHKNGDRFPVLLSATCLRKPDGEIWGFLGIAKDITQQKQMEAELRKNAAHLASAQQIAHLGSWEFDFQTQQIYWSAESFEIYGRDPRSGMPTYEELRQLIHPDDRDRHDHVVEQASQNGKSYQIEYRFYHSNGSLRYALARGEVILDVNGKPKQFIGTVQDITDHKLAEEKLQSLSDRLSLALKAGAIGTWDWDIIHEAHWDDRMYELYGIVPGSESWALYQEWLNILHPDDRASADAAFQAAVRGEKEFDTEFRIIHADGSIRHIKAAASLQRNQQGEVQRAVGINYDITERKQIEAALRESERRYATLAEASPVAIFRIDAEGNCVYINERWSEMTGRPTESALGMGWLEAVHPEDREYMLKQRSQSLSKTPRLIRNESRHLLPDGSITWVYAQLVPETNPDGNFIGYIGTLTDITSRKQIEAALWESERRYASLAEASPVAIFRLDAAGQCMYVNERWCEMTGRPAEEAMGYKWLNAVHPEDRDRFIGFSPSSTSENIKCDEGRHLRPDGSICWFYVQVVSETDTEGKIIGYVGTLTDITARKEAEIALQESERRYANLAHTVPVAIFRFDSDINCVYVNNRWSQITGRPTEAAMGRQWLEAIHPEDRDRIGKEWAEWAQTYKPGKIFKNQGRHIWPDGKITWFDSYVLPETNQENRIIGYIGTIVDVTDRKEAEIALKESERRYATLAEAVPVGIIRFDAQGNCIYVNERWCDMTGQSTQAALGMGYLDVLHPEDRDQLLMDWSQWTQLSQPRMLFQREGRYIRPDGNINWFSGYALPEINPDGSVVGYVGTLTDITERKQSEFKLRKLSDRLALAVQSGGFGIWEWDIANDVLFWDERMHELYGVQPSEFDGVYETWIQRIHPDDRAAADALSQRARQGETEYNTEFRVIHPDGSIRYIKAYALIKKNQQGEALRMVGVNYDITERKLAELELIRNRDLREVIYNESTDAIFLVDPQTLLTIDCNRRAVELFAANHKADLIGISGNTLQHQPFSEAELAAIEAEMESKGFWSRELEYVNYQGNSFWGNIASKPITVAGRRLNLVRITDISDRKQTEEILATYTRELADLYNNAPCGYHSLDADGRFVNVNDTELQWLGYSYEEIIGQPFLDYITEASRPVFLANYPQFKERGWVKDLEFDMICKDGTILPVLLNATAVKGEDGIFIASRSSIFDIRDRKQAEQAMMKYAREVEDLYDNAPCGYHSLDSEGKFIKVNQTELQWLGYTREEMIGKPLLNFFTESSREAFFKNYPRFLEQGVIKDLEYEIVCKDGTILPVLISATAVKDPGGNYIYNRATMFDIREQQAALRERKQAELELQESRTMLRLVLDTIPQRVFWKDCESRYIGCNPSFANDYQLTPDEIIGKTDLELPWAEWAHLYRADDAFVINTKIAKLGYEEPTINLNGDQVWLRTSKVPLTNSAGEVIGILGSYEDITERKQAEEQLQHTNHQLAHANVELARATRLKDEFLANMSHELRTPLNAILGMSEGLQEAVFGEVNERQIKAISTIERSGKHLLELINDILDLSKIESGKLELQLSDVPVRTLCDASISFIKQMALKKNIGLSTRIAENLGNIYVDDRRLRQVLINLLSNAIKFTPEGGSIRLEVSLEEAGEQRIRGAEEVEEAEEANSSSSPSSPPPPHICFSVIDTGIGIRTEDISKLFQPFMQLDSSLNRQYNGTGLGLALVQRIATLHGGTVSVSSTVGEGSCFIVRIPYQTSDRLSPMQVTAPLPSHRLPADNAQVLIIEDSIPAAEQITRYLTEMGMQPVVYPRGEGSVEEVLRVQPAFILLDLQLPNLSGWDVLNQLQNNPQTKEIPVIIISVVDERTKGLAQGAAEYIVKPITRQQFQATLEKLQYNPRHDSKALIVVPQPAVNSPLILLADDNQANIDTMSGYLESRGYRLILAKNGQEALEFAKSQQPDLIIMDVQMPVMDGLEAMRHLRQERQFDHVPIIALTALAMPGDRENCLDAGANEYLSKPIKLKQLAVTIQQLLGK